MLYTKSDRLRDQDLLRVLTRNLGLVPALRALGPVQLADIGVEGREGVLGVRDTFIHVRLRLEGADYPDATLTWAPEGSPARENLLAEGDAVLIGDPSLDPYLLASSDNAEALVDWLTPRRRGILVDLLDTHPELSTVDLDRASPRFDWPHLCLRREVEALEDAAGALEVLALRAFAAVAGLSAVS